MQKRNDELMKLKKFNFIKGLTK